MGNLVVFIATAVPGYRTIDQCADTRPFLERTVQMEPDLWHGTDMQQFAKAMTQKTGGMIQYFNGLSRLLVIAQHRDMYLGMAQVTRHAYCRDTHHAETWILDLVTNQCSQFALDLVADTA